MLCKVAVWQNHEKVLNQLNCISCVKLAIDYLKRLYEMITYRVDCKCKEKLLLVEWLKGNQDKVIKDKTTF